MYIFVFCFSHIGCAGSVGIFLAGRVIYFRVCDSAVWSAGPVQFYSGTFLERMAGLYRLFLFSGSVVAGTVRLKWWRGGVLSFSRFLQFAVSSLGGWMSVVGFLCYIIRFSLVDLWFFLAVSYFVSCWFSLIRYRWYRQSRNLEDQEPLLEQTRLEHRRLDIETRIEQLESDVRSLKSDHVMLEDGAKKDSILSEICGLDNEIFQLKAELATVNSLLSSY